MSAIDVANDVTVQLTAVGVGLKTSFYLLQRKPRMHLILTVCTTKNDIRSVDTCVLDESPGRLSQSGVCITTVLVMLACVRAWVRVSATFRWHASSKDVDNLIASSI